MQERISRPIAGQSCFVRGTVGPEGSVLCIPVLILVIVVLLFTRSSPQPPLEVKSLPSDTGEGDDYTGSMIPHFSPDPGGTARSFWCSISMAR